MDQQPWDQHPGQPHSQGRLHRLFARFAHSMRQSSQVMLALGATVVAAGLAGCADAPSNPQPSGWAATNTLFSVFLERSPKYLDPTASYSADETPITYQIYEPPYEYHYLKRPYTLQGRTTEAVAVPQYFDKAGKPLPADAKADEIARSVYTLKLRKGIKYQPHPAFAKGTDGQYLYHNLTPEQATDKRTPFDFEKTDTRELVAADYEYAFKRHAYPRAPQAPIFSTFADFVVGLSELSDTLKKMDKELRKDIPANQKDLPYLDFRNVPLEGVKAVDSHTLQITLNKKYPQFDYWLAMTFAAPIPWEADKFYNNPSFVEKGLTLNVWPIGTGPYMLTQYQQNRRHILERNPNWRKDPYPCEGMPGDKEKGLLEDCGKPTPFIDRIVYTMEKETIPIKEKFKQGYYDMPSVERPEYGIEFLVDSADSQRVADTFKERGFQFPRIISQNNWYMGFNWLDPVIGKGNTPEQQVKNRKLRQAISIATDWEEYQILFERKAGEVAMEPVPGGMFGSRHGTKEGMNPVTHDWVDGKAKRKPIEAAQKLLAEAGYPGGRDAKTGKPLVINYDYQRVPTPELKAELDWMVKQYGKLGIQLEIRATDYNTFQDKMRKGGAQVFWWGWNADYPDPENFLFLLYGPNSKAKNDGENAANYQNDEYDKLYEQMAQMNNTPERQALIDKLVKIVQQDSPWMWGFFQYYGAAAQGWMGNVQPSLIIRDAIKFYKVNPQLRVQKQAEWNQPRWWPIPAVIFGLFLFLLPAWVMFRRREREVALAQTSGTEFDVASARGAH